MAAKTKKTPKQKTYITKPTLVAVGKDAKGKLSLIVGSRRIASFKGEVVAKGERYWSQLVHLRIGRDKGGKFHLTTSRDAVARKLEVVR